MICVPWVNFPSDLTNQYPNITENEEEEKKERVNLIFGFPQSSGNSLDVISVQNVTCVLIHIAAYSLPIIAAFSVADGNPI